LYLNKIENGLSVNRNVSY